MKKEKQLSFCVYASVPSAEFPRLPLLFTSERPGLVFCGQNVHIPLLRVQTRRPKASDGHTDSDVTLWMVREEKLYYNTVRARRTKENR